MNGRTGLVVGGVCAVTASVAVVCAVAFSHSAALADSAGSALSSPRVLVPAATAPAVADAEGSLSHEVPVSREQGPQLVDVPAPVVVDVPPTVPADAPDESIVREESLESAASAGAWDTVRERARARGWSDERIEEWIAGAQGRSGDQAEPAPGDSNRRSDAADESSSPGRERESADQGSDGRSRDGNEERER